MIKRKDDFVKGIASRGKASAVGDRKRRLGVVHQELHTSNNGVSYSDIK